MSGHLALHLFCSFFFSSLFTLDFCEQAAVTFGNSHLPWFFYIYIYLLVTELLGYEDPYYISANLLREDPLRIAS